MKTADLLDAHEKDVQVCDLSLLIVGRRRSFSGPIATVECLDDHSLVRELVESPGAGRVLVVDGGGSLRSALFGDRMAEVFISNGWAGIVLNGAIRDHDEIDAMDIGVRCLGVTPRRSGSGGKGRRGSAVTFGGVRFQPGDHLYCDADGVVVAAADLKGAS